MSLQIDAQTLLNCVANQRNSALDQLAQLDALLTMERAESAKLLEKIKTLEAAQPNESKPALKAVE